MYSGEKPVKKVIIIVVIVVVAIGSIDPYSSHVIESGFKEKKPDKVMSGALWKMRMFSYGSALNAYKKLLKKFPDCKERGDAQYYIGYCLEKTDRNKEAIKALEEYLSGWPNGDFASIAKQRLSSLKSNSMEEQE